MFPNANELENYIVKILVLVAAPLATKYGIDGNTEATIAAGLVAAAATGWSIYSNHNMVKVPESTVPPTSYHGGPK